MADFIVYCGKMLQVYKVDMADKLIYTQLMFNRDMDRLADQINKSVVSYDCIIGLARGGLIPAVCLSHKIGVSMTPIVWQTRDGGIRNKIENLKEDIASGANILIVDDMIDSGHALKSFLDSHEITTDNVHTASLFYNIVQPIRPDYYCRIIDRELDNRWIEFWWEQ